MAERDPNTGHFRKGNSVASGHARPHAKKIATLRRAMLRAISTKDVRRVVKKLLELALEGDLDAIKILLDRVFGQPIAEDVEQRLADLEEMLESES